MNAVEAFWSASLTALFRATWEGALLGLVVFAIAQGFRKLPASVRAGAYWLTCLRFLVGALVPYAVALPLLPAPAQPVEPVPQVMQVLVSSASSRLAEAPSLAFSLHPALPAAAAPASFPWMGLFWAVWLVGVAVAVERRVVQHRQVRGLLASARRIDDPAVSAIANALASRIGVKRVPALYRSEAISTPLVTGMWRPRIILPDAVLEAAGTEALRMALAHELAHLSRGDLFAAWVPAIAEALFWFFPPVRWCAREYAQAREEACDVVALAATGAAPADYGQLLLSLGVARKAVAVTAACGASPHFHHLRRRLLMLQHATPGRNSRLWSFALVLGAIALVPVQVVAREASAPPVPSAQAVPPVPPAPAAAPAPLPPLARGLAIADRAPLPPRPPRVASADRPPVPPPPPTPTARSVPVPPTPPVGNVAPVPPFPPPVDDFDDLDGLNYVFVDGDSTSMSGDMSELRRAKSLKSKYGEHFLWVRQDGKEYVITDPNTLSSLRVLAQQQQALGNEQGKLGDQQGKLGDQQGTIGDRQGELGAKMGELGAQIGEIASERAELALRDRDEKDEQFDARQAELDKKMHGLEQQLHGLAQQQAVLARQQADFGRQQAKLGRQQAKLAREFIQTLRKTVDHAVKDGTAKPLN